MRVIRHTRPVTQFLAALAAFTGVAGTRADEYVDRVNAPLQNIAEDKRSDAVLLPLLAAMDHPPGVLKTQERAALLGSSGPGWTLCADWAQKPAQKTVIEALARVTAEEDRLKTFAFAQPYGADAPGVSVDLVAKQMFTELGDPPLLAAAKQLYMPALENAGILAHVEASRLIGSGDAAGAIRTATDWLFFCRQVADRPFLREKRWAMDSIRLALERIRDLAYTDLRAQTHSLDPAKIRDLVQRLRDRKGPLAPDRLAFPEGDFIAREQALGRIMLEGAGADEQTFAPTLARIAATDRPLQLFGAAAFWDSVRAGHANTRDTRAMLQGVRDDFVKRWNLPPFDRVLATFTDYRKQVAGTSRFASLQLGLGDVEALFPLRRRLQCEAAGTRMALGVYGYLLRQRSMPRTLGACRPEYIPEVDKDPYSRRGNDIEFFVPVRDTPKGPNGEDKPHTIQVAPAPPFPIFQISLGLDQFVVYSVGPDDDKGWAAFATQDREGVPGDYLLFPPTLSLYRQRLLETNQLK